MKKVFMAIFAAAAITSASAVDFALRLNPIIDFPLQEHYKPGFGGLAQADVQLFDFLTTGVEGGILFEKPEGYDSNILFLNGGIGVGAFYNLFSRMYLGGGGSFGVYSYSFQGKEDSKSASDFYFRGYGELGFRFTPSLTLAANGGYISYNIKNTSPVMSGPFAGLSLKINLSTDKIKNACTAQIEQETAVYPLFMQLYKTYPVAVATVTNCEAAEITNVTISFSSEYSASELKSAPVPVIRKMKSAEIPLTVDFSSALLGFTGNGSIPGKITIEYELLGKKKKSEQPVSLTVNDRDSYTWGDYDSFAAFISPDTPEVKVYAESILSNIEDSLIPGMSRSVQVSAAVFEALRASGLSRFENPRTPYVTYHLSKDEDEIRYPILTMKYKSGDFDDVGILLASCLEACGVGTAFIPLDDDFLILVNTDTETSPLMTRYIFADEDRLIEKDGSTFFALSMKDFNAGFVKSRATGAKRIAEIKKSEEASYNFIITEQAWLSYPPAVFTRSDRVKSFEEPSKDKIRSLLKTAVDEYVSSELNVVVQREKESGDSNKIGLSYVSIGKLSEAESEFNKAIAQGSVPAMNNLANVYFIQKNYAKAEEIYNEVLAQDAANETAMNNLASVYFVQKNYEKAEELYKKVLLNNKENITAIKGLEKVRSAKK